jgi:ERCC4-related helicase
MNAAKRFKNLTTFFRNSGHGNRDSKIKGMCAREQVEKSKAFKRGDFNVLVSTSVCKEGIDVGTCKVGIEHGGLISTTELTQFMGKSRIRGFLMS